MAYQVVLYDKNGVITDVLDTLEKVVVEEKNISWAGGGLVNVKSSFLVLDQSIAAGEIGSRLDNSLLTVDQKSNLKSNMSRLQADIVATQEAINFLLGL